MLLATRWQREAGVVTRLHRREADGRYALVTARFDPAQAPGEESFRGAQHQWVSREEAETFFHEASEQHVAPTWAFPAE